MLYAIVLSFALAGHVEDYTKTCPDLLCVAAVMVRTRDMPGLARIRVWHGAASLLRASGAHIFPPLVDEQYQ